MNNDLYFMNKLIESDNIHNFLYSKLEKDISINLKIIICWIAVHGFTDIITYNLTEIGYVLMVHLGSCIFVVFINKKQRFYLLLLSSLYHVGKDYNILLSFIIHIVWIYKPISSLVYLSLVHVPLHYYRFINKTNNNICSIIIILNILTALCLPNKIINMYDNMWWVGPVIGHIILNI